MNQPYPNLGSFFQFPNPCKAHLRPNWLRSAKRPSLPKLGFVFSTPPSGFVFSPRPATGFEAQNRPHPSIPSIGFVFSPHPTPPKLASKRNPHPHPSSPPPTHRLIFASASQNPPFLRSHHHIYPRSAPALCYSISSTGCKLNGAPAFQVTPDRVRSKLLSVAYRARPIHASLSSGPERPSLVNLSHSQTPGSNREGSNRRQS